MKLRRASGQMATVASRMRAPLQLPVSLLSQIVVRQAAFAGLLFAADMAELEPAAKKAKASGECGLRQST